MAKKEKHLFIVWSHAKGKMEEILSELRKSFSILNVFEITWDADRFEENLRGFYSHSLSHLNEEDLKKTLSSKKENDSGEGSFYAIVVSDSSPKYQKGKTSNGEKRVNKKTFEHKEIFRELTGGGYKIHSSNTPFEFNKDMIMLFSPDYLKLLSDKWDGKIVSIKRNVMGVGGWANINEFFNVLNQTVSYVVLRNFEGLPDDVLLAGHDDIDVLTDDLNALVNITGARKVYPEENRVHYKIEIGAKEILFDFRFVGDEYYDKKWQESILAKRVLKNDLFYIPEKTDYFYTLLYHALVHKPTLSEDYSARLEVLSKECSLSVGSPANFRNSLELIDNLSEYMKEKGFRFVRPLDTSVFYNKDVVEGDKTVDQIMELLDEKKEPAQSEEQIENSRFRFFLSGDRENLLSWFDFKKRSKLLELSPNFGALTRLLCEKTSEVTSVISSEGEKKVIQKRVGKIGNLKFLKRAELSQGSVGQFDYIVAIGGGSLEKTLSGVKSLLKKEGQLILAADNSFGLKFWAGAKVVEDSRFFCTIEGQSVETVTQFFLRKTLKEAGFTRVSFYYPLPDYRYPVEIFSDDYLPGTNHNARSDIFNYQADNQEISLFDQKLAFDNIVLSGEFKKFANSFLVIAGI